MLFRSMIVSHTVIPTDIQKKVNYCFYDSKNEILTDWDLLNQPWFNPNNDRRIQSSFLSKKNTHLAIWRMMILGFSLSKNMGYNKVHHIEYDCEIKNDSEFDENSKFNGKHTNVTSMWKGQDRGNAAAQHHAEAFNSGSVTAMMDNSFAAKMGINSYRC